MGFKIQKFIKSNKALELTHIRWFHLNNNDADTSQTIEELETIEELAFQSYQKLKKQAQEVFGHPLAEDVVGYNFTKFPLTEMELLADKITLFEYKNCRFGVMLWQEDKDLPIGLYITAWNPAAPQPKALGNFGGELTFWDESIQIIKEELKYGGISHTADQISVKISAEMPLFTMELQSRLCPTINLVIIQP